MKSCFEANALNVRDGFAGNRKVAPKLELPKNKGSVARRNERERRRIKNVNLAFDELREHVPTGRNNKRKISKVDTLQSAIEYIKVLETLVKQKRETQAKMQGTEEHVLSCDDSQSSFSYQSEFDSNSEYGDNINNTASFNDRKRPFVCIDTQPGCYKHVNTDGNDSGFSDDRKICERLNSTQNSPTGSMATPDSTTSSGQLKLHSQSMDSFHQTLNEVSVDDVETILSPYSTPSPSLPLPSPIPTSYPTSFNPVPTHSNPSSPLPFASTPLFGHAAPAFSFPIVHTRCPKISPHFRYSEVFKFPNN